jgi:hypothetical protein
VIAFVGLLFNITIGYIIIRESTNINAVQPAGIIDGGKALLKSGIYFSKTRLKDGTIFFKHIAEGIVEELDLKIV